jgi:hypothetical protein
MMTTHYVKECAPSTPLGDLLQVTSGFPQYGVSVSMLVVLVRIITAAQVQVDFE